MKNFYQQHLSFPARLGIAPYYWLVWMVPAFVVTNAGGFNYQMMISNLILLLFIKIYRDSFWLKKPYVTWNIYVQLIICFYFAIAYSYLYLFIFPSFLIGALLNLEDTFYRQLTVLYLAVSLAILMTWLIDPSLIRPDFWVGAIFSLIAPLVSRSMIRSQRRQRQLATRNQLLVQANQVRDQVRDNERQRIAADLHDNVGQAFSLLAVKADLAEKIVDHDPEKAKQEMRDVAQTARDNLTLIRQIVSGLTTPDLMVALAKIQEQLTMVQIDFAVRGDDLVAQWPQEIGSVIIKVMQEATANVIRHSQARHVTITFSDDSLYQMTYQDDGIGLRTTSQQTFGLAGIKQRVEAVGGQVDFENQGGLVITVQIPKGASDD